MGSHKRSRRHSDDSGSSSGSSSSEDERKRKKENKKSKKLKKEKHKHKEMSRDKEELLMKAKELLKQHGATSHHFVPAALPHAAAATAFIIPSDQRITSDDYFRKSSEFIAWLSERKGLLFSELSSDDARRLFETSFVIEWNSGGLRQAYYAGLIQPPAKRTSHKWAFESSIPAGGSGASQAGMGAYLDDKKDARVRERVHDRDERRKEAKGQRELLDELLPKATGRDAVIEKKMARREEAKARDSSPDRNFLPGGGDMMGGDDSFAAAKAREARQEAWQRNKQLVKREELSAKLASAQAKEDEKMAQFRAMLQQGPITIQKRAA
jgi:hypothetical protein